MTGEQIVPGYKLTDVGVIPSDWRVCFIEDICKKITTGKLDANAMTKDGNYPFFTCAKEHYWINEYAFDEEALLISGNGANVGYIHYYDGKFNAYQRTYVLTGFNADIQFSKLFMEKTLNSRLRTEVNAGNTPYIVMDTLAKMSIPIPPTLQEQRAIVSALSDVEALLAKLDQLIAKKRDLKQATMQQLLTGQTRLPGFSGEWEVKRLGDVAKIKTGSKNNQDKIEDGEYPFFVRSATVERINSYSHDCEAILVPGEGGIGSIFHYINGRFDVHQRVYAITQFQPYVSGKFVHLYMSTHFGAHAMQNSVKATVDSLRLPTFLGFELRLPPTFDEQAAIVIVLSNMDVELESLTSRRDKTLALKQGMMQELLTGRIRFV